jgi:hypothetical protein
MRTWALLVAGSFITLAAIGPAHAASEDWKTEITPYIWAMGMEGDVTVGTTTVSSDVSFSDLADYVQSAMALLGVVQYKQFLIWAQVDANTISTDAQDSGPTRGELDAELSFLTAAAGYQFNLPAKVTLDAMVGGRYARLDTEFETPTILAQQTRDQLDPLVLARARMPLMNDRLVLVLMGSIGTGQSDLTAEIQPQVQFQITENVAALAGYRRVYYDIKNDNSEFSMAFHGFLLGLGVTF